MAYQIATITQHNAMQYCKQMVYAKRKKKLISTLSSFYSTYYAKIAAVLLREDPLTIRTIWICP